MFGDPPYSNGHDFRYEAVKNEIRFRWGKKSISEKDKPLLKALAVVRQENVPTLYLSLTL